MPKIVERLMRQLRSRGVKDPYRMAVGLARRHGLLKPGTMQLTVKGAKRNGMTAGQRAKSRAAKYSGRPAKAFKYNAKTNRARLRKRSG